MARDHGPAWSTTQAPPGPLQFRLVVTGCYDGKWVWAELEVLPRRWEAGRVYDAGVQVSDVSREGCYLCDTHKWQWRAHELDCTVFCFGREWDERYEMMMSGAGEPNQIY
jgi:hypothetical protein